MVAILNAGHSFEIWIAGRSQRSGSGGNRTLNTILFGFLGGTVGAAAAGVAAYAFSLVSYNGDPVFVLASDMVGRRSLVLWTTGWGLHLVFGMAIGGVASLAITRNSQLLTKTMDRKVSLLSQSE